MPEHRRRRPRTLLSVALLTSFGFLCAPAVPAQQPRPKPGPAVTQPPAKRVLPPQRIADVTKVRLDPRLLQNLRVGVVEQYRVYRISADTSPPTAASKVWEGHIALPEATTAGRLTEAWFPRPNGLPVVDDADNVVTEWFYKLADGSYTKVVQNPAGVTAGLFTIAPSGARSLALDLEGDRRVDLFMVGTPEGTTYLVVDNDNGLAAFDRWLTQDVHPLCQAGVGAASRPGVRADSRTLIRASCGRSPGGIPGGTGGRIGKERSGNETFMDRMCEDVLARPRPAGTGLGSVMDPESDTVGQLIRTFTLPWRRCEPARPRRGREIF
jgi:hypothetical protein